MLVPFVLFFSSCAGHPTEEDLEISKIPSDFPLHQRVLAVAEDDDEEEDEEEDEDENPRQPNMKTQGITNIDEFEEDDEEEEEEEEPQVKCLQNSLYFSIRCGSVHSFMKLDINFRSLQNDWYIV